ncbi:Inner membrane transport permease YhhJ [Roseimaritima multifibrata]|uniref:Inner membrane transport permease YhhJ n=1 Tax=Roseimaritima multifibrata TaxID=1930274 RepID=A0A517MME2_9BACT|nr:ABC transporter permease [Roseimaritima multifibrata]QDS96051.1 Inner membrane transport permease YhhJ [Roseimaritima multifibrata]
MNRLVKIFWLGTKELRSLQRDKVLLVFLVYSFTVALYVQSKAGSADVHNASIGIVDEDRSALSARIVNAFLAPQFQTPETIDASEVDDGMDASRFMFVLDIPPNFERYVVQGRPTEVQLNIDATAVAQAGIGASYIQSILSDEISRFQSRTDADFPTTIRLVTRRAFNPNGNPVWFGSLMGLINQISMLTIILTGAALIREREHGTIEHLLVMPLTSLDIALAKVWANSLLILIAVVVAILVVIRQLLEVPIAGSISLFLAATVTYLFFATALGIFLGTISRTMAQFAMLVILTIVVLQMLSGGMTPVESQPEWLQAITFFLPSRHFVSVAQAVVYRGAGFDLVWTSFLTVAVIALAFFLSSLALFRRSMATR